MTKLWPATQNDVNPDDVTLPSSPCDASLVPYVRETFTTDFGARLDWLRDRYEWTWREMGRNVGLKDEKQMRTIALRGACTMETLKLIKKATRVNLNWLICGEGTPGLVLVEESQEAAISREIARRTELGLSDRPPPPPRKGKPSAK